MFDEELNIWLRWEAGNGFTGCHVLRLLLSDQQESEVPSRHSNFLHGNTCHLLNVSHVPGNVLSNLIRVFIYFSPHNNHLQQLTLWLFYIPDEFQSNLKNLSKVIQLRNDSKIPTQVS